MSQNKYIYKIMDKPALFANNDQFINSVYNHFPKVDGLLHSKEEIKRIITSDNILSIFVYVLDDGVKKLIGYGLGDSHVLPDGRYVCFISYLYVVSKYRNNHIGSMIMNLFIKECKTRGIPFIMLLCHDSKISYYNKFGFTKDRFLNNELNDKIRYYKMIYYSSQ